MIEHGDVPVSAKEEMETTFSRRMVRRIFSLPSFLIGDKTENNSEVDDVVVYPVVGFRWVAVESHGKRRLQVLPTTSKGACSILPPNNDEEPYGWFSPACRLGSVFTDDDAYCSKELLDDEETK